MREIARENISWLAGPLEGEGYFRFRQGSAQISLGMTDLFDYVKFCRDCENSRKRTRRNKISVNQ